MNQRNFRKKSAEELKDLTAKELLSGEMKPHFKGVGKNIKMLSPDEQFQFTKYMAKILGKGNDVIAQETRHLLYNSMKEHFEKCKFYFNHLPQHKKATELRQLLTLLPSESKEDIASLIKNK
ncbi:hypothetical protein ACXGQW_00355 [Wenyingzhuangia sp. IMCC45533]